MLEHDVYKPSHLLFHNLIKVNAENLTLAPKYNPKLSSIRILKKVAAKQLFNLNNSWIYSTFWEHGSFNDHT